MEQTTESFVTSDVTVRPANFVARLNQSIAQALVIPFRVIVLEELTNGSSRSFLPEEDHAIQALTLQASHESFHVRIQVWTFGREEYDFCVRALKYTAQREKLLVAVE